MSTHASSRAIVSAHSGKAGGQGAQPAKRLTDIRIDFGPREELAQFFLMADTALRRKGVFLGFGTFEELVETNRRNRDSWLPIVPSYDPANGLCDLDKGYVLIGRNAAGEIVVAQGTIIFDWVGTNFKDEAESMRIFYASPETRPRPQERCIVTAPSAASMSGRVALHGAAWWHPSVRGRLLGALVARVSRLYAYARWRTDLSLAINSEKLIAGGFPKRNGYQHIEPGVAFRNFEMGNYDGGIVWITEDELFVELSNFMSELAAGLDQGDVLRTA
jgi:hypothetical protein